MGIWPCETRGYYRAMVGCQNPTCLIDRVIRPLPRMPILFHCHRDLKPTVERSCFRGITSREKDAPGNLLNQWRSGSLFVQGIESRASGTSKTFVPPLSQVVSRYCPLLACYTYSMSFNSSGVFGWALCLISISIKQSRHFPCFNPSDGYFLLAISHGIHENIAPSNLTLSIAKQGK